jgi:antitoxin (DNA-binding transcriptional repressor) of toxin-antitoxin stability system
MRQIEVAELSAQIETLLAAVKKGEEIVLTRFHEPVAMVVQFTGARQNRQAGSAAGQIIMSPDFDEPLEDFQDYMP